MVRPVIAVLWLISCMGPLRGATLERLSLDDLIAKSTSIVRGQISGVSAALAGGHVLTHVRVQVLDRWKGPAESTLDVVIPGGTAGRIREVCSGAPILGEGQQYVLFLWKGKSGVTQIMGLTQGVFTLPVDPATGQTMAVRPASGETMLAPGTSRVVNDQGVELPLASLSSRIASVLAGGAK